jgi:D-alanyl-D-alanine carboxypeptidase (penicillin-binding protein 5/6)
MMAQILILEEVEKGNLKWDEKISTSANAAGYGGTQIYLESGEVMTARDLMKAISMASANDATVAMAERIAGSEEKFVEMMNKKAKELGLKNTNFVNPTGLDEDNHYSSSYDLSIIARELLKHKEILEFTSIYEDYLRQDTPNKFWLVNTNKLVRTYSGVDGLKTGFTDKAGYTMAVTAKNNNMRLIAIVLGEDVSKVRNKETAELLDYGFVNYKVNVLKKKDEIVDTIKINKGNKKKLRVVLDSDVKVLTKKSDGKLKYDEKIIMDEVKLPIHVGDKLGILELYNQGKKVGTYNLVSKDNIKKKNIFSIYLDNLKRVVVGDLIF